MASPAGSQAGGMILRTRPTSRGPIGARVGPRTHKRTPAMGTVLGSEILAQALKSQGVDTMFYIMGGPMLETEATCIKLGIRAIDTRHEQAAALSAEAWGRVMRKPGVCMGASGPGATNLLTGVADAFANASPLVAIGGSSPRVSFGMEAFQEIDQLAVFKPVTKWAERIYDARRIDRKSTRLNSSHGYISYAVLCLKKK